MPRTDRTCCGCEYVPTCCTACTDCQVTSQEINLEFNITPVQFGCSNATQRACDPNLIPDYGFGDEPLVMRRNFGCNQQDWSRDIYSGWEAGCSRYYQGDTGPWPVTDDCPSLLCGSDASPGTVPPCFGNNVCSCFSGNGYKQVDGICINGDPAAFCGINAYQAQFNSCLSGVFDQNCKRRESANCCSLTTGTLSCANCIANAFSSPQCNRPDSRSAMPSVGSGLKKKRNEDVSGTFRFYLTRGSDCLESIAIGTNTGSNQYTAEVFGTTNYLVANPQSCSNTDPPSPGLTCKQFTVDFFCWLCPFCSKEWGDSGYPVEEGVKYMTISGSLDVKNATTWDPAPLNGASSGDCAYTTPPAPDSTLEFEFSTLFAPVPTADGRLKYSQVWSLLKTPDALGTGFINLYGLGVDFEGSFTI